MSVIVYHRFFPWNRLIWNTGDAHLWSSSLSSLSESLHLRFHISWISTMHHLRIIKHSIIACIILNRNHRKIYIVQIVQHIGLSSSFLFGLLGHLLNFDRISILHIIKNGLSGIQIIIIASFLMDELSKLFLMFFVHEFYKFSFKSLINVFNGHCLVNCILQLLRLGLDVLILVLYFLFNSFHMRLNIINVINSFLSGRFRNVIEDPEYIHVLSLQILYLFLKSLIFTSELHQVVWHFNCLEHCAKLVNKIIDDLIESTSDPHQAFSDFHFPILHNIDVFLVAVDCILSHFLDLFEIFHFLLIGRIDEKQLFWGDQTFHTYISLLLFRIEISRLAMLIAKHFNCSIQHRISMLWFVLGLLLLNFRLSMLSYLLLDWFEKSLNNYIVIWQLLD